MRYLQTFISSIISGAFIAFGGISYLYVNYSVNLYLAAISFTAGLLMISFLGLHLFTGKVGFAFEAKRRELIELPIILVGNFIGACLIGIALKFFMGVSEDSINLFHKYIISVGDSRLIPLDDGAWLATGKTLISAILCGACVYLACYFYKNSKHLAGKILGIIFPISIFVLMGAQHCIANMFYLTIADKWSGEAWLNILIVTVGNIIGAFILYWMLYFVKKIYEVSAGAVIYKKGEDEIKYLVLKMKQGHTSLCKGHIENDETLVNCAKREIKEETNLDVNIDTDFHSIIHYRPYEDNKSIIKFVHFYLAEDKSNDEIIDKHDDEVIEAKYVTYSEAMELLTHDSDKKVLTKANSYLKSN